MKWQPKAVLHKFYLMESDGAGNYVVYSGPSAKKNVNKTFKGPTAKEDANKFLRSLP